MFNLIFIISYYFLSVNAEFFFSPSLFVLFSSFPVVIYDNPDTQKLSIFKNNLNKAGVYRWRHKSLNKSYVGSGIQLTRRLKSYYNLSYMLNEIKKNNSAIYRALIKYGHSSFLLEILEYCSANDVIEKEQYYLDLLKPEYNILKHAGSLLGFKHSVETRMHMSSLRLGKPRSPEIKRSIQLANAKRKSVIVENIITKETEEFNSIRRAAKYIGMHHSYLSACLAKNSFYKGKLYNVIYKVK